MICFSSFSWETRREGNFKGKETIRLREAMVLKKPRDA